MGAQQVKSSTVTSQPRATAQAIAALLLLMTAAATAQSGSETTDMQSIDVPRGVQAGQPVTLTIRSGANPSQWCGVRVNFGDGETRDIKIDTNNKQFPLLLEKTYKTAGQFDIKAAGARVTTRPPCPGSVSARIQVNAVAVAAAPAPVAQALPAQCADAVPIRNASGETVSFGLRQMVRDAGGLVAAREQVARRIIETQDKALDDKLPAADRDAAKRFAETLKSVRDHLARCS